MKKPATQPLWPSEAVAFRRYYGNAMRNADGARFERVYRQLAAGTNWIEIHHNQPKLRTFVSRVARRFGFRPATENGRRLAENAQVKLEPTIAEAVARLDRPGISRAKAAQIIGVSPETLRRWDRASNIDPMVREERRRANISRSKMHPQRELVRLMLELKEGEEFIFPAKIIMQVARVSKQLIKEVNSEGKRIRTDQEARSLGNRTSRLSNWEWNRLKERAIRFRENYERILRMHPAPKPF